MGSPDTPEVTEPSRLVGKSSGGEVWKQQLDTRVRQEPPGGPVSGVRGGPGRHPRALEPRMGVRRELGCLPCFLSPPGQSMNGPLSCARP